MAVWIALLRGINVTGNNIVSMADLRRDLESLDFKNVRTYIQSGNVVFESAARRALPLSEKISGQIAMRHGFRPHVLVLSCQELAAAIRTNPFPEAAATPQSLHFFFLQNSASHPDRDALESAKGATERYKLTKHVFYLHAPDGIGRSKLAANAEKYLGVVATARNYRTVCKLLSLCNF